MTQRSAPLKGVRIIELSSFVASPLAGMTLAQLGADVIRVDPNGGGIDHSRWPITDEGESIYWASLNKGKRSLTVDLRSPEGQAIVKDLVASAGIVITNMTARGWLSYENLAEHRPDLILVRLLGNRDGSGAVDYTVNAASGFPIITGADERPVNNALPAWDVSAGLYLATSVLAAELERRTSGQGQEITLALSDVMLATVGNLGYIAEVQTNGSTRGPLGNGLYGAYGQSFATADGREVMVVIITNSHWKRLGEATGLTERLSMIGPLMGVDLGTEGGRYEAREAIDAVLRPWFAERSLTEVQEKLRGANVLQGAFRTFEELVNDDPDCSLDNPLFTEIDQPRIGKVLAPGNPAHFSGSPLLPATVAPTLGADTDDVLASVLGYSEERLADLRARGITPSS